MTEQFLDRAQVGAGIEQVGGEAVPELVGGDAFFDAATLDVFGQHAVDARRDHPRTPGPDEKRTLVRLGRGLHEMEVLCQQSARFGYRSVNEAQYAHTF